MIRIRRNLWRGVGVLGGIIISGPGMAASPAPYVGPPVAYDGWTLDNGAINTSVSCGTANISCQTITSDKGFVQELVTDQSTGMQFIRAVLTDPDVTGSGLTAGSLPFAYEVFTRFANASNAAGIGNGMAEKLSIQDAAQGLDLIVMQQRGEMRGNWAGSTPYLTDPAAWSLQVSQNITDTEIGQSFNMTQYTYYNDGGFTPDGNTELGKIIKISTSMTDSTSGDQARFEQVHADGYYGGWGNTFIGNPIIKSGGTTQTVSLGGTTVTWAESSGFTKIPNDMTITWVGAMVGGSPFGAEHIQKAAVPGVSGAVGAAADARDFSFSSTGPFIWISDDPFSPAPTF